MSDLGTENERELERLVSHLCHNRGSLRAHNPCSEGVVTVSWSVSGILSRPGARVTIHLVRSTRGMLRRPKPSERTSRPSLCLILLRVGLTEPHESLRTLVRSYRTVSPLPVIRLRRSIGGLFSVALSVRSPRPGSRQHSALRSPDFPRHDHRFPDLMARSPDRLTVGRSVRRQSAQGLMYAYRNVFRLGVSRVNDLRAPTSSSAPMTSAVPPRPPNWLGIANTCGISGGSPGGSKLKYPAGRPVIASASSAACRVRGASGSNQRKVRAVHFPSYCLCRQSLCKW